MENIKSLGEIIKELRKSKGYTQATLADKLGLNAHTVKDYEANRRKPSWETSLKLASELGVTQRDLFSGELIAPEIGPSILTAKELSEMIAEIVSLDTEELEILRETLSALVKPVSKKALKGKEA